MQIKTTCMWWELWLAFQPLVQTEKQLLLHRLIWVFIVCSFLKVHFLMSHKWLKEQFLITIITITYTLLVKLSLYWASIRRNPVHNICRQIKLRSVCTFRQSLSAWGLYGPLSFHRGKFMAPAILNSHRDWPTCVSSVVGKPQSRFSCDVTHTEVLGTCWAM